MTQKGVEVKTEDFPLDASKTVRSADYTDVYANNIRAAMSPWDISLHFGRIVELASSAPLVEETTTVRVSPQTAKILATIFPLIMSQWEERFGSLSLPNGLLPSTAAVQAAFAVAGKRVERPTSEPSTENDSGSSPRRRKRP